MRIIVESKDLRVIWALREGSIPEGISIQVARSVPRGEMSITGLNSPVAVVSVAADVQVSLLSSWLYDKVKDKRARLTVNHRRVETEKDEIAKVLQEEMMQE